MKQMSRFRKSWFFLFFLLLFQLFPGSLLLAADNLIHNPGMEKGTESEVTDWKLQTYTKQPVTLIREQTGSFSGNWHVTIKSDHDDDIRLVQIVRVSPDTLYKISARVKTENVPSNHKGVNLALLDQMETSPDLTGTHQEWQPLTLYIRTARDTQEVKLCLALGGFGSMNRGKVAFDEVMMEPLSELPAKVSVLQIQMKPENLPQIEPQADSTSPAQFLFQKDKPPLMLVAGLVPIGFLLLLLVMILLAPPRRAAQRLLTAENLEKILPPPPPRRATERLLTVENLDRILPAPPLMTEEPSAPDKGRSRKFPTLRLLNCLLLIPAALMVFILIWNLAWSVRQDPEKGNESLFLHQASALLEGKIAVETKMAGAVDVNGKNFIVAPLLPSLVVLPWVFFFGMNTKITLLALAMAIGCLLVLYTLLHKLKLPGSSLPWLLAAFFAGTGFFFCLTRAYQTTLFSHLCASLALLLALNEAFGKCRGWLTGLFLALAFLSREATLLTGVFLFFVLQDRYGPWSQKSARRQMLTFTAVLVAFIGLYLGYNWARFGSPFKTGLNLLLTQGAFSSETDHGLFHPAYLPVNFHLLFLQGLSLRFTELKVTGLNPTGSSLLFASPFLLLALLAKIKKPLQISAWLVIGGTLLGQLFYHSTGAPQWNTARYTLDFLPLLMLLTALGTKEVKAKIWKGAVVYALGLNTLALWIVLPKIAQQFYK